MCSSNHPLPPKKVTGAPGYPLPTAQHPEIPGRRSLALLFPGRKAAASRGGDGRGGLGVRGTQRPGNRETEGSGGRERTGAAGGGGRSEDADCEMGRKEGSGGGRWGTRRRVTGGPGRGFGERGTGAVQPGPRPSRLRRLAGVTPEAGVRRAPLPHPAPGPELPDRAPRPSCRGQHPAGPGPATIRPLPLRSALPPRCGPGRLARRPEGARTAGERRAACHIPAGPAAPPAAAGIASEAGWSAGPGASARSRPRPPDSALGAPNGACAAPPRPRAQAPTAGPAPPTRPHPAPDSRFRPPLAPPSPRAGLSRLRPLSGPAPSLTLLLCPLTQGRLHLSRDASPQLTPLLSGLLD